MPHPDELLRSAPSVKMFGLVFDCSTCVLTVCPSSPDVCKLRLDFDTFVLADPVQVMVIPSINY